ncbi:MAG: hypothetical protein Q4B29_02395 [Candidatus Saccharibacteria bacterium]|nr:hypothetical protein [Candidatus Saccharibacteria bacterium]
MGKERNKKGLGILLSVFLILIVGLAAAIVVVISSNDEAAVEDSGESISTSEEWQAVIDSESIEIYEDNEDIQVVKDYFEEKLTSAKSDTERVTIYLLAAEFYVAHNLSEEAVNAIEKIDEKDIADEDKQRFYVAAFGAYLGAGNNERAEEYNRKMNEMLEDDEGGEG